MHVTLVLTKSGLTFGLFVFLLQCADAQYNTVAEELVFFKDKEANGSVSGKTCRLKPDEGPCRGNIPMYYFEPSNGECRKFSWGGCQGNGNRFDTRDECEETCFSNSTETTRPRWCFLTFDYGYCFGAVRRYYYDHHWQVCKERIYSGCGGNRNNFYSFEQCESICRFGKGKLVLIKQYTGLSKKIIIINPLSATKKGQTQAKITAATAPMDPT